MKVKRDIILYIWESVTKANLATGNFHKFLIRITTEITNRLNKEKYIFYNLITDRGYLPTKIKSIEFPLLPLLIWNRKASKDRSIVQ